MSAPAISISFFDPRRQLYGTARAGATVLFEGISASALPEGPALESSDGGVRAELPGRLALDLEPVSPEAELSGIAARVCRVRGEVSGQSVECLGLLSETRVAPAWDELDALRSIYALLDEENAVLVLARRPRGALGHGQELVNAALVQGGELLSVEEARVSTVYDGEGRQRTAGLELWLPGEDFPRRGSGSVIAGSSLELEGLHVHVAVFNWRVGEREGLGAYELMVRAEPPAVA